MYQHQPSAYDNESSVCVDKDETLRSYSLLCMAVEQQEMTQRRTSGSLFFTTNVSCDTLGKTEFKGRMLSVLPLLMSLLGGGADSFSFCEEFNLK